MHANENYTINQHVFLGAVEVHANIQDIHCRTDLQNLKIIQDLYNCILKINDTKNLPFLKCDLVLFVKIISVYEFKK